MGSCLSYAIFFANQQTNNRRAPGLNIFGDFLLILHNFKNILVEKSDRKENSVTTNN